MYGQPQVIQQPGMPQQYAGAPMHQQYAGAPQMHQQYAGVPQMQQQYAGAPQMQQQYAGAPQMHQQYAGAPQAQLQQPLSMQHVPQQTHQLNLQPNQQVVMPGGVMPQSTVKQYTPEGGEMLQITIMGSRNAQASDSVHVQVAGKHDFTLEAQPINGPVLQPKTTVTYAVPGDGLVFTLLNGGTELGRAELRSSDFHPGGFEGDVPLSGGASLAVKITPLGSSGQIQQLAPISVQMPSSAPIQANPPVIAGTSGMRMVSPEEFQFHGTQAGALPVQVMSPQDMQAMQQASGMPMPALQPHMMVMAPAQ